MLDWLGVTTYERDILGRITKAVDHNNAVVRYTWGLLDERQGLTYPNRDKVKYSHDIMGRLKVVGNATLGVPQHTMFHDYMRLMGVKR